MSITRRILESAQSGIHRLTSLVIVDDEPLSQVEAAALQAEITARKEAREKSPRHPLDNPLAKLATSTVDARGQRQRQARERLARVQQQRDRQAAADRAASDEVFRRMKDQARTGAGSSPGAGPSRPPRAGSHEAQLADWYRTLDLSPGADLSEVKTAYRKMMRKYHPDLHNGNSQKQKAANELSLRVTAAYNGLCDHLEK
jgi:DnaJ-domain-containing protein 1